MTSKIILMMPKNQSGVKKLPESSFKESGFKILSSFKNQDSRIIKIKIQDSRFKNQEKA